MTDQPNDSSHFTGRRQFLKSILGFRGLLGAQSAQAHSQSAGTFYWTNVRSGQVGFPTGKFVVPGLPGSLMKLIASAAMREEGLFPATGTLECPGHIIIHRKTFTCQAAHGRLTLTQALAHSCNVFFAQAAQALSPEVFLRYAKGFGLGEPVAGMAPGLFPAAGLGGSENYVLGLAKDLQPQSLQILRMVALIATRGVLPFLHSAEEPDPDAAPFKMILSEPTWQVLEQGMRLACREGTARGLDHDDRLHLAAKTGTVPHGKAFQSWIAGYFPFDSPRYAFCAHASSGTSQDQAVPLAQEYLFSVEWP